jgi:SAM-dependent methyltransferase
MEEGRLYRAVYRNGTVKEGQVDPTSQWQVYALPETLAGLKVYDYGTWNGGLALEAHRRGALEAWALDSFVWERWPRVRRMFEIDRENVAPAVRDAWVEVEPLPPFVLAEPQTVKHLGNLSLREFAAQNGPADITIAGGVLYHLKNPLKFIEDVKLLVNPGGMLYMSTWCVPNQTSPAMQFVPGWHNDATNYWLMSELCVVEMLRFAGFNQIESHVVRHPSENEPYPLVMFQSRA